MAFFKALAEFIMRSRFNAVSMALLGSIVPLLSQGVVALVSLRKGWQEAVLITLWASLPAMLGFWVGSVGVSLISATIMVFVVTCCASLVLRLTASWTLCLLTLVLCSGLFAVAIAGTSSDLAADITQFFKGVVKSSQKVETDEEWQQVWGQWTVLRATGLVAWWIALSALMGVFIGRWWQALLYNPGGFRQEFHLLRLAPTVSLPCAAALIFGSYYGHGFDFWASLAGIPLLAAGYGFLHWVCARFSLGMVALAMGYILLPLLSTMMMLVALLDSVLNLRKLIDKTSPSD